MARKTTYLYKVLMRQNNTDNTIDYCYARNKKAAIDGMKEIYKDMKYSFYDAVCFGEAEFKLHPLLFEKMSPKDVAVVQNKHLADADKYSRRKEISSIPENGTFVTPEELDGMLA